MDSNFSNSFHQRNSQSAHKVGDSDSVPTSGRESLEYYDETLKRYVRKDVAEVGYRLVTTKTRLMSSALVDLRSSSPARSRLGRGSPAAGDPAVGSPILPDRGDSIRSVTDYYLSRQQTALRGMANSANARGFEASRCASEGWYNSGMGYQGDQHNYSNDNSSSPSISNSVDRSLAPNDLSGTTSLSSYSKYSNDHGFTESESPASYSDENTASPSRTLARSNGSWLSIHSDRSAYPLSASVSSTAGSGSYASSGLGRTVSEEPSRRNSSLTAAVSSSQSDQSNPATVSRYFSPGPDSAVVSDLQAHSIDNNSFSNSTGNYSHCGTSASYARASPHVTSLPRQSHLHSTAYSQAGVSLNRSGVDRSNKLFLTGEPGELNSAYSDLFVTNSRNPHNYSDFEISSDFLPRSSDSFNGHRSNSIFDDRIKLINQVTNGDYFSGVNFNSYKDERGLGPYATWTPSRRERSTTSPTWSSSLGHSLNTTLSQTSYQRRSPASANHQDSVDPRTLPDTKALDDLISEGAALDFSDLDAAVMNEKAARAWKSSFRSVRDRFDKSPGQSTEDLISSDLESGPGIQFGTMPKLGTHRLGRKQDSDIFFQPSEVYKSRSAHEIDKLVKAAMANANVKIPANLDAITENEALLSTTHNRNLNIDHDSDSAFPRQERRPSVGGNSKTTLTNFWTMAVDDRESAPVIPTQVVRTITPFAHSTSPESNSEHLKLTPLASTAPHLSDTHRSSPIALPALQTSFAVSDQSQNSSTSVLASDGARPVSDGATVTNESVSSFDHRQPVSYAKSRSRSDVNYSEINSILDSVTKDPFNYSSNSIKLTGPGSKELIQSGAYSSDPNEFPPSGVVAEEASQFVRSVLRNKVIAGDTSNLLAPASKRSDPVSNADVSSSTPSNGTDSAADYSLRKSFGGQLAHPHPSQTIPTKSHEFHTKLSNTSTGTGNAETVGLLSGQDYANLVTGGTAFTSLSASSLFTKRVRGTGNSNASSSEAIHIINEVQTFLQNSESRPAHDRLRFPLSGIVDLQEDEMTKLSRRSGYAVPASGPGSPRAGFSKTSSSYFEQFDNALSSSPHSSTKSASPGAGWAEGGLDTGGGSGQFIAGLPHPKPKHNILQEHVANAAQVGHEYARTIGRLNPSLWNTGAVAERVQLFEAPDGSLERRGRPSLYQTMRPALQARWNSRKMVLEKVRSVDVAQNGLSAPEKLVNENQSGLPVEASQSPSSQPKSSSHSRTGPSTDPLSPGHQQPTTSSVLSPVLSGSPSPSTYSPDSLLYSPSNKYSRSKPAPQSDVSSFAQNTTERVSVTASGVLQPSSSISSVLSAPVNGAAGLRVSSRPAVDNQRALSPPISSSVPSANNVSHHVTSFASPAAVAPPKQSLSSTTGFFTHAVPNSQLHQHPRAPLATQEKLSPLSSSSPGSPKFQFNTSSRKPVAQDIPRFHFPRGRPVSPSETEMCLRKVAAAFNQCPEGKAREPDMPSVIKAAELPLYWKKPVFLRCRIGDRDYITFQEFKSFWISITRVCHDDASRFVTLLSSRDGDYLVFEDFVPLIQDIVNSHPGLTFLREAAEFHSRYVHTVISRIFFSSAKPWSKHLTIPALRKSNLLQTIARLEEVDDINQVTDYFSYEHFYVVYCKFWELDRDHDLLIDASDLARHNDYAISSKIIDRIFSGAVNCDPRSANGKMAYTDFVWFLIAEEDKRNPTSVEYWFRCMDLDGDGVLSYHELNTFYDEQIQRLESRGIDPIPFSDILCQLIDVVRPKDPTRITLNDLKHCQMAPVFFDTFINVDKYLDMERRDGAAYYTQDEDGLSDWERFAAEEYEQLVAEESAESGDRRTETEMSMSASANDSCSDALALSWSSSPPSQPASPPTLTSSDQASTAPPSVMLSSVDELSSSTSSGPPISVTSPTTLSLMLGSELRSESPAMIKGSS